MKDKNKTPTEQLKPAQQALLEEAHQAIQKLVVEGQIKLVEKVMHSHHGGQASYTELENILKALKESIK